MTMTTCLLLLPIAIYILWSTSKIIRLLKENDALRAESDRNRFFLRKYDGVQPRISLTLPEKRIILNALENDTYKEKVTDPRTKRFIRIIYNTLVVKLKESIIVND